MSEALRSMFLEVGFDIDLKKLEALDARIRATIKAATALPVATDKGAVAIEKASNRSAGAVQGASESIGESLTEVW